MNDGWKTRTLKEDREGEGKPVIAPREIEIKTTTRRRWQLVSPRRWKGRDAQQRGIVNSRTNVEGRVPDD